MKFQYVAPTDVAPLFPCNGMLPDAARTVYLYRARSLLMFARHRAKFAEVGEQLFRVRMCLAGACAAPEAIGSSADELRELQQKSDISGAWDALLDARDEYRHCGFSVYALASLWHHLLRLRWAPEMIGASYRELTSMQRGQLPA